MTPKNNILIGVMVALVVAASWNLGADPIEFAEGLPNLGIVLDEVVEELSDVDGRMVDRAFWSMIETIQMAFVGTMVGYLLAFPMSLLASRNLVSKWLYIPVRTLLAGACVRFRPFCGRCSL